jgi:hypothetical protein
VQEPGGPHPDANRVHSVGAGSTTVVELITYDVDATDVIRAVGGSWAEHALANGGDRLVHGVVGRRLWDFIGGATTQHMYQNLVGKVRESGEPITFPFRCDSPALRRDMRMHLLPLSDGWVRFESLTVQTRAWPTALLARQPASKPDGVIRICSWCKKGKLRDEWVEPEVVVEELGMFIGDRERLISHAICPPCAHALEAALQGRRRSAEAGERPPA